MLDILAAVVEDALVGALVLLLQVFHAQDDGARLAAGPRLEAAPLALGRQVFEALTKEGRGNTYLCSAKGRKKTNKMKNCNLDLGSPKSDLTHHNKRNLNAENMAN